jgi:hypothetical protein
LWRGIVAVGSVTALRVNSRKGEGNVLLATLPWDLARSELRQKRVGSKDLLGAVVVWVGVVSHWLFDWTDYHLSRILAD